MVMKKLLSMIFGKKNKKRRTIGMEMEWMKDQISQMNKMNQGVISMALGRE